MGKMSDLRLTITEAAARKTGASYEELDAKIEFFEAAGFGFDEAVKKLIEDKK